MTLKKIPSAVQPQIGVRVSYNSVLRLRKQVVDREECECGILYVARGIWLQECSNLPFTTQV